jgi:ribose transport system ATP-binding protein
MTQPVRTLLDFHAVTKRYGATVALDGVSFRLQAGEVCGLLGENGAGKSTLVKILSGIVEADTGEISIADNRFRPRNIVEARAQGVSTAFQELSLVPSLSVAVNMFLPHPPASRFGLISTRQIESAAEKILRRFDVTDIVSSALVEQLPLGQRQRVEIVRAMQWRSPILLLDEPTAALTDRNWLFALVDAARSEGAGVLYISHKLDEIRRLCSRCIILRNGRKVLDDDLAVLGDDQIFSLMAGRAAGEGFVRSATLRCSGAAPALETSHLNGPGVRDVSFALARGEILGVAGLEGQGQSSLFKALSGLSPVRSGSIRVGGLQRDIRSPRVAQRHGLVLVPEERKSEGLFADLTTVANISLPVLDKTSSFRILSRTVERRLVDEVAPRVSLPPALLPINIGALSGGNQQKAILARALLAEPKCLLLFDPTRGVDVGAKQHIYKMMRAFAEGGGAILLYSTELDELVGLCDRCLVLYRGGIAAELEREEFSQDLILAIASGHRLRPRERGAREWRA